MHEATFMGSQDMRAVVGEGSGSPVSIFATSQKEEMRRSRNRKALLGNIIKHCNISCQRRLWALLP